MGDKDSRTILALPEESVKITAKKQKLLAKAQGLPNLPGCYLMQGRLGQVLYVGKAKSLKSRVSSYFNNSERPLKVEVMASKVEDFDFIVVANEAEAFVLENNLIKKHAPKYNIRLRDDKSYPYVLVDFGHAFPRIEFARKPKTQDGTQIFGPFPPGFQIGLVIKALNKSLRLRDCSDSEFKNRTRPCLLHQIHQCSAPCVNLSDQSSYQNDLESALRLFGKKGHILIDELKEKMAFYARDERFEEAANIRDQIPILEDFLNQGVQKNAEILGSVEDLDVFGIFQGENEVDLVIYFIRQGSLLGQKTFHYFREEMDFSDDWQDEGLEMILSIYADGEVPPPAKIVVPFERDGQRRLQEIMELQFPGKKFKVISGQGKWASMAKLANDQAQEGQRVRIENQDSPFVGLNRLKELLGLREIPRRIELVDVAVFQGTSPTAGLVVARDGKPSKDDYRHFHLKELSEGNNDFEMMREFARRRFKENRQGEDPDVLVVDGGKGQVSVVSEVIREINLNIPVVGLAKAKTESHFSSSEINQSEERLIINGRSNPYFLRQCPSLFKILVSLRDEAHRFSRRLHHHQESKRFLHSWVDEVEGIGPKGKEMLNKNLRYSPEYYRGKTIPDLMRELRVNSNIAKALFFYLSRRFKDR